MNEPTGGNGMKILLIEDSETCSECLLGIYNRRWFCLATGKDIDLLKSRYEKPTWCPLRPLPQKMTMEKALKMERCGSIRDIYTTWDACLAEITGETE